MMKWGRKKSSLPSPSHSSSSSTLFRLSWFSKIKRMRKNIECKPTKGKIDIGCKGLPISKTWENGRFYGGNDDNDWRLSFGDDDYEVETRRRGGLKSVFYGSDDDVAEREEALKFNQMVTNIRRLREFPYCNGAKSGRKVEKERKSGTRNGDFREKRLDLDLEKLSGKLEEADIVQEKDIFELKPVKTMKSSRGNHRNGAYSSKYNYEKNQEDYKLEATNLNEKSQNSEWEKLKEMKFKEVLAKSESQRKSVYITTKNNSKVRAYSPRTAYKIECKIKAIEDMKRAKKKREKVGEERGAFGSFAVVKSSSDPQSDFKESMVEMITAKGINKAEELEELLACYLTLNADEYHDTIIKVFKQVWFELIRDLHLDPAIHY